LILLREAKWRRPLYGIERNGHGELTRIENLLSDLPRACGDLDAGDVLDASQSAPTRLARLNGDNWLQRIPTAQILLSPHPLRSNFWSAVVRLIRDDGSERETVKLEVPPDLQPVMQWLVDTERPLRVAALAGQFSAVSFAQIKTLLDVLVRASYLKLLRHVPLRSDGRPM
jgi:hypothetical protein